MNKYENDNLNGYGYNTRVELQSTPMNQETFIYDNLKGTNNVTTKGYLSNLRPTFDPQNMQQANANHGFMYQELLNLLQYSPGSTEYNIKGDALLVKFLTGSVWFGGQIINHDLLKIIDQALNEQSPQCFNPSGSAGANCPLSSEIMTKVLGKIADATDVDLTFYSSKPNPKSTDIDYDYWPVDGTGNSKINSQKISDDPGLHYSNNLSYFKGPSMLPQVKGIGRLLYRTVIDKSPASVAQVFETNQENAFFSFNLVPFNPATDHKFTYLEDGSNNTLYGIDPTDKTFQLSNNSQSIRSKLSQTRKNADGSYNVIVNNYFAHKNNLKVNDNFTFNADVPTEQMSNDGKTWSNITDLSQYNMDPFSTDVHSPDVFYGNRSIAVGSQSGSFRNTNVVHKMRCHVIDVSNDSISPYIFMQKSTLNKFISDSINIQWNSSEKTPTNQASWQDYYNGMMNQQDPSPLLSSLVSYNPNGSYNILGLAGGKVPSTGKRYKGTQLAIFHTLWSKSFFKTSFSQFKTFISAILIIISVVLTFFSILFLLISINIILKENRKKILLYKTLGYSNKNIATKFILVYYLTALISFIVSIPIMILGLYLTLNWISNSISIFIIFAMPWFVPVAVFGLLLIILGMGFFTTMRYIKSLSLTRAATGN